MKSKAGFFYFVVGACLLSFFLGKIVFENEGGAENKEKKSSAGSPGQDENSVSSVVTIPGIPRPPAESSGTVQEYVTVRNDLVKKIKTLLILGAVSYDELEALGKRGANQNFDAVLRALSSKEIEWEPVAKQRFVIGVWGTVLIQGWENVEKLTVSDPQLASRLNMDRMAVDALSRLDPERAIKYTQTYLKGADYHRGIASAVIEIANRDVEQAKDYMADMAPGSAREQVAAALASKISKDDITLGLEWANGLSTEEDRKAALTRIAIDWGHRDPKSAVAFLNNTAKSKERDLMIHHVAGQIAGNDGKKAIEWLSELDPTHTLSKSGALQVWTNREPEKALKHVSQNFKDEENALIDRREALNAYQVGAEKNPEAAAEAIILMNDDRLRAILTPHIASRWMRLDPIAASTWVNSLDSGKVKDKSIEEVINGTSDSMEKLIWATAIGDKKMRIKSFRKIGSQILENDQLMDQVAEELSESQLREFLNVVSDLKPENR